jgi:hypothetical protein
MVSFQPPPAPVPVSDAVVDPFEEAPRWRFQGRDLLALAAIAAAVWFAIRGAEGMPFHHSGSLAAAEGADQITAQVTLDRNELRSLARAAATQSAAERTSTDGARGDGSGKSGGGSGGSGSKGHPKSPTSGGDEPLLQATIPGVGTVTVEDPNLTLPDDPANLPLPPLPETLPLTLGIPTLPLL